MTSNAGINLDDLDLQILEILIKDARTPYLEIARVCHVSGGTIHVRMKKMEDLGIIKGTKILLDMPKLGYDVCCFVGIYLDKSSSFQAAIDELSLINEIVELHYTTGDYAIFTKLVCKNIAHLQDLQQYQCDQRRTENRHIYLPVTAAGQKHQIVKTGIYRNSCSMNCSCFF